jgi:hypothetical protein
MALGAWICILFISTATLVQGGFAEPGFPFLTSTVDARNWSQFGFPRVNVVPRGLIVRLPNGGCICFDQELLRVAAVWQAQADDNFLTWTGTAPISWDVWNRKSEGGQSELSAPRGEAISATSARPGWIVKERAAEFNAADIRDLRPLCPSPENAGRGPMTTGRWEEVRMEPDGTVSLHYRIGEVHVIERWPTLHQRHLLVGPCAKAMFVLLDEKRGSLPPLETTGGTLVSMPDGDLTTRWLMIPPHTADLAVTIKSGSEVPSKTSAAGFPRWPQVVEKTLRLGDEARAFVIDTIPLPEPNPWGRLVRPTGLTFDADGDLLLCTIDGDVWHATGLDGPTARWRRVASGLHEPLSLVMQGARLFSFTRDGIVELLRDTASRECVAYRNFCNGFTQTPETREFAMDMVAKPGGGFYVSKGGQQLTHRGGQAGRVLEISADGLKVEEFCSGLRQAFLGINPRTGMLTASDQQGHWIPSTPIHVLQRGAYYGFPDAATSPPPTDVTEATCWLPHRMNQSAAGHVWLDGSRLTTLEGSLLHLSYFRPDAFRVYLAEDGADAAAVALRLGVPIPLLKGSVRRADGTLFLTGFQIWGTDAKQRAGLVRVRQGKGADTTPTALASSAEGITLTFSIPIDPATLRPESFAAARWHYRRSRQYGSAHYLANGTPGEESLAVESVQITADGRAVFLKIAAMTPVPQLQLAWNLTAAGSGHPITGTASMTIHRLGPRRDAALAYGPPIIARPEAASTLTASAKEGARLAELLGCRACHSLDGTREGMKGPSWKGLFASTRHLIDGTKVQADEAYLTESILNPVAKIAVGFNNPDIGMPPYEGALQPFQVESLVLYLKSLGR